MMVILLEVCPDGYESNLVEIFAYKYLDGSHYTPETFGSSPSQYFKR